MISSLSLWRGIPPSRIESRAAGAGADTLATTEPARRDDATPGAGAEAVRSATVCVTGAAGGAAAMPRAVSWVREALTRAGAGRIIQPCPAGETRNAAITAHAPAPAR